MPPAYPLFAASPQAERASLLPAFMFVFLVAMFVLTIFLRRGEKERLFNSWVMKIVAILVLISDAYVVYRIVNDVVQRQTGQHEIGPTTVWVSYLFLSVGPDRLHPVRGCPDAPAVAPGAPAHPGREAVLRAAAHPPSGEEGWRGHGLDAGTDPACAGRTGRSCAAGRTRRPVVTRGVR